MDAFNERAAEPDRLPSVLVVVNGVAELLEASPAVEEPLGALMRVGPRYGMHFLLVASARRDVHLRLRASASLELVLSLADGDDYTAILGSVRGAALPGGRGRGLVRQGDDLYMFQCAYVAEGSDPYESVVAEVARQVERWGGPTRRIPAIPALIGPDDALSLPGDGGLPLGLMGDDFSALRLGAGRALMVSAGQPFQYAPFLRAASSIARRSGWGVVVVDGEGMLGTSPWWAAMARLGAGAGRGCGWGGSCRAARRRLGPRLAWGRVAAVNCAAPEEACERAAAGGCGAAGACAHAGCAVGPEAALERQPVGRARPWQRLRALGGQHYTGAQGLDGKRRELLRQRPPRASREAG